MSHTSKEGSVQHHITFRKIDKYMYNYIYKTAINIYTFITQVIVM